MFDAIWKQLFPQRETLIAIDIGTTSIRLMEVEDRNGKPTIIKFGSEPLPPEVVSNYGIVQRDPVRDALLKLLSRVQPSPKRVALALPSPAVFAKRIKVPAMEKDELEDNVRLEAAAVIPHSIDQLMLDFAVVHEHEKGERDVLVLAVKNETLDSYQTVLEEVGLQAGVIDVDYFALGHITELLFPEVKEQTAAIVNIGSKYSSLTLLRNGKPFFAGDLSLGGRSMSELVSQGLGIPLEEAEKIKRKAKRELSSNESESLSAAIDGFSEEFNRQITFLWTSAMIEQPIEKIYISGGGAHVAGLVEGLAQATALPVVVVDPTPLFDVDPSIQDEFKNQALASAIACGLTMRAPNDREVS